MSCAKVLNCFRAVFFEYDTLKIVNIKNPTVGIINRLVQLLIIGYVVGYAIVWKKGYQEYDDVLSSVSTKVKGIAVTNYTELNITHPDHLDFRIWDVADYVMPPQENNAFFVMTNVIFTPNQTLSKCPEDPDVTGSRCTKDSDCTKGSQVITGNGVRTGRCIHSPGSKSVSVCEVYAWCPVELDKLQRFDQPILSGTEHFTVLLKNNIEFPKFSVKSQNIFNGENDSYLQQCRFNPDDVQDRLCPIFSLSYITERAGVSPYNQISIVGGVIAINIEWNCNLDHSIDYCIPKYTFKRLDQVSRTSNGTNFRFASFYDKDGISYRDMFKAYGVRFIINVSGRAGKFNIIPLLTNIGSGIGLLAVATVLSDLFVLNCVKKKRVYREKKYQYVAKEEEDEDCYKEEADADGDEQLLTTGVHHR